MLDAAWDETADRWNVTTEKGAFTADVIVAAPGPLSEPSIPDLPGLDTFAGRHVPHRRLEPRPRPLRPPRRVPSAPARRRSRPRPGSQPEVEALTIFQRTPPWVLPHSDRPITDAERALYRRFPIAQRAVRTGVYFGRELLVPGLAYRPKLMGLARKLARRNLQRAVADPALRERRTPDYEIGCKRILPSNRWYPTLTKPNVELVTDGIDHVRPDGIVTRAGEFRAVDTIIFATGFHVTDIRIAHRLRRGDGRTLDDVWGGSPRAYRGTTIPGFPNLFFLVGPNTGLGHNSIIFMIEAQLAYVMDALAHMRAAGATRVDVKADAERAYNDHIQHKLARSVWNTGGCSSWYLDRNGRNATIWPDFTFRFWGQMRRFDPHAYELTGPRRGTEAPPSLAPA